MTRFGYRAVFVLVASLFASAAFAQTTVAPQDFVLFADETLKARGLIVESGDVGANVSVKGTKKILAPDSRIVGSTVDLHPGSTCEALLANGGQSAAACGPATPVSTPVIADVAAACGAPSPFPTCNPGASVFVPHDATTTLPPGAYGDVIVSGGGEGPGTLKLSGGDYTFCNVRVNRNGQLLAQSAVTVNITGTTKFDNGSNVGPEGLLSPCEVRFFSNGDKFRVSRKGHLQGVVCAPNAKLEFTAGATLRGVFFGREVKTDKVTLDHENCLATTTTTTTGASTSTSTTTTTVPGLCNNGVVDPGEPCDPSSPGGAFNCPPGSTCSAQCTCEAPPTTSTTTTTVPGLCNNGVVDPGEPCDPSSPGGAFNCPPGSTCSAQCTCEAPTTTSTTGETTSTVTTTSTTTTTLGGLCNNGVVDPGEPCDPSSPGGAFNCPPGSTCSAQCTCEAPTTTSTTGETTSTVTTTSTTTTTLGGLCNNGVVDPGEPCDPSSPGGAFDCPPGSTCSEICTCLAPTTTSESTTTAPTTTVPTTSSSIPTTTSTSAPIPTTTSTSAPIPTTTSTSGPIPTTTSSSTTATPTTSSTTSTTGGGTATAFDFLSTAGGGICGQTFRDLAGTIPLKNLLCGNLSLGGGISQVPDNTTPPGSTNRFALSGCAGGVCNIGSLSPSTAAYDCTGIGCFFGTPLPISNAGLSVCVTNTFSEAVAGTLNTATGAVTMSNFKLNSATVLTGNPAQPCPRCAVSVGGAACVGSPASPCTGVCDGSPNQGAACLTKNPTGLTGQCPSPAATAGVQRCYRGPHNNAVCAGGSDCACHTTGVGGADHTDPAPCSSGLCAQFIGDIPITLNPLTTGTASFSSATGIFCPAQSQTVTQKGAFRTAICTDGTNSGKPCDTNAECPGSALASPCRTGTLNNICNGGANDGKGCVTNTTCGSPGVCVKAGTLAQLVKLDGAPAGALTTGVATPIKLASTFCVAATAAGTVNGNANLPGPGATALVGTITLVP